MAIFTLAALSGALVMAQEAPSTPPPAMAAPPPPPATPAPADPGGRKAAPAKKKGPKGRAVKGDTFRFLHFQERRPGQALDEIELRIDGDVTYREVRYLGQVYRDTSPTGATLRDVLVRLLRDTEVWPFWEGDERGCISFGDGAVTREARLGHRHNADPAMERVVAIVRLESFQMTYVAELLRYATDEPSLATGTIASLVDDIEAARLVPDARILGALRRIESDRTVRALVREGARQALRRLGAGPTASEPVGPRETPAPEAAAPEMSD